MVRHHPSSPLFPYTTLFRSLPHDRPRLPFGRRGGPGTAGRGRPLRGSERLETGGAPIRVQVRAVRGPITDKGTPREGRSEEHTSNSSHLGISYAVFCLKKKT